MRASTVQAIVETVLERLAGICDPAARASGHGKMKCDAREIYVG